MSRMVTCTSVGVYEGALTRGRQYEVLEEDVDKRQVKVRSDRGRARWFPTALFDVEGRSVSTLVSWQIDEAVSDEDDAWVEVSFALSDGSRRWCSVVTPGRLARHLDGPVAEPAVSAPHLVVVRSVSPSDIERALRALDRQGMLVSSSLPLDMGAGGPEP